MFYFVWNYDKLEERAEKDYIIKILQHKNAIHKPAPIWDNFYIESVICRGILAS